MKPPSVEVLHRAALVEMLEELESCRLCVVLVPSRRWVNEGGCVRVAVEKNARWYSDFCSSYPSGRRRRRARFDTLIKRANTLAALLALLRGDVRSVYAAPLLAIARHRAAGASDMDRAIMAKRRAVNAIAAGFSP